MPILHDPMLWASVFDAEKERERRERMNKKQKSKKPTAKRK
jgi:hypothetical protein